MTDGTRKCENCKATLIDEEIETHTCLTQGLQWFFKGDEFWGNDGSGWVGFSITRFGTVLGYHPKTGHNQKKPGAGLNIQREGLESLLTRRKREW